MSISQMPRKVDHKVIWAVYEKYRVQHVMTALLFYCINIISICLISREVSRPGFWFSKCKIPDPTRLDSWVIILPILLNSRPGFWFSKCKIPVKTGPDSQYYFTNMVEKPSGNSIMKNNGCNMSRQQYYFTVLILYQYAW